MRALLLRPIVCSLVAAAVASCTQSSPPTAAPSPSAAAPSPIPLYRLVNDTGHTVDVLGCGSACPRRSLGPGQSLDFTLGFGRVEIRRPGGTTTCLRVMNGVLPKSQQPRQVVSLARGTSAAAC